MTVQEYREQAQKAALRVGSAYLKVFIIYVLLSSILLFLSLRMQQRVLDWQETVRQFILAGDTNLPPATTELWVHFALALLLIILSQVLRSGWFCLTLSAVRGQPYSWRDLTARLSQIHKVFTISVIKELGCLIGLCLFVAPGVMLFYRWRLCWFVLAEHPEYGPIKCLRQSAQLMVGEKMNLFRLDLSLLLPYSLALIAYYFTYGVVGLWELPSISLTHSVFYNAMTHWEERQEPNGLA